MRAIVLAAFILSACAAGERAESISSVTAVDLDTDPMNLQIEIGRYGALLGQVIDHTGIAHEFTIQDVGEEINAATLMAQLDAAVKDYNGVRAALCASEPGAATYATIRAASCASQYRPQWRAGALTDGVVALRSREAGRHIIGLWVDVCDEARRLQPEDQQDDPVCPME